MKDFYDGISDSLFIIKKFNKKQNQYYLFINYFYYLIYSVI